MTLGVREVTCRELTACLADYFAGALGSDERSLFEGHLAKCPDCVAYLGSYVETTRLAKDAYEDDPVPAGVPEQLIRAILAAREHIPGPPTSPPRGPRRGGLPGAGDDPPRPSGVTRTRRCRTRRRA